MLRSRFGLDKDERLDEVAEEDREAELDDAAKLFSKSVLSMYTIDSLLKVLRFCCNFRGGDSTSIKFVLVV